MRSLVFAIFTGCVLWANAVDYRYFTDSVRRDAAVTPLVADFMRYDKISIDARAAVKKIKEQKAPSAPEWGLRIAVDSLGRSYTAGLAHSAEGFGSPFDSHTLTVAVWLGDSVILTRSFEKDFSLVSGGENTLMADIDSRRRTVTLSGGNRRPVEIGSFAYSGTLAPGFVASVPVAVSSLSARLESDPASLAVTRWTAETIADYLSGTGNPVEGYWSYLDRENDPQYATVGGRYRLAVVADPDCRGAYDILYVEGAEKFPGSWHAGMKKGRLTPTRFAGHYDLEWNDASFLPIRHDIHAQFSDDGAILTLSFPLYRTSVRFFKEIVRTN